jgi:hypothetical protein
MALDEVRALVAKLSASAEALHALGAAPDAQASGMALDGQLEPQVDEVLMALGVKDSLNNVNPVELRTLLAQMPLSRLRTAMFGGWVATPQEVEALLRSKGFADVRALPSPPTAVTGLVVGQRRG